MWRCARWMPCLGRATPPALPDPNLPAPAGLGCRVARRILTGCWQWTPQQHCGTPPAFQAAARTMLLINRCRGFPVAAAAAAQDADSTPPCTSGRRVRQRTEALPSGSGSGSGGEAGAVQAVTCMPDGQQLPPPQQRVSLEPELLLCVLRHAGADWGPWVKCSLAAGSWHLQPWDTPWNEDGELHEGVDEW